MRILHGVRMVLWDRRFRKDVSDKDTTHQDKWKIMMRLPG
jgi:hypothetical protein